MSLVVLLCHRWNSIYQLVFSFVCLYLVLETGQDMDEKA